MLIIVEGTDRTGKSTLVGQLAQEVTRVTGEPVKTLHKGPPTEHPLDEYVLPLTGYRPTCGLHYVLDRWHLGEVAYPRVLGRPTRMNPGVRRYVEQFLRSRGALLVLVGGRADEVSRQLREAIDREGRKVSGVQPEHAQPLLTEFWEAYRDSWLTRWHVPHWSRIGDLTVADIVREAAWLAEEAERLAPFTTYVGSPAPYALLLGDARGDHLRADDDRPAFMPYPSTSGGYLLGALGEQVRWMGVANACDVDDYRALWQTLGRPPVVALGRRSILRTADLDPAPAELPHPQYVRRFNHRRAEDYGVAIVRAVGRSGPQGWDLRAGWPIKEEN